MGYEQRKKKLKSLSKVVISQQDSDTKENGIENHFLTALINRMVRDQADRIKEFVDFIFNYAREHNVREFDDRHSVVCKVHLLSEDKDVLSIHDETIYGPNLQHILVVNDKKKGDFHIRKLRGKNSVNEHKNKGYDFSQDHFVSPGFIMTYHYSPDFLRRMNVFLESKELTPKEKESFDEMKKIEEMGDNTYHLYECVVYSTSLMSLVKRDILSERYGK